MKSLFIIKKSLDELVGWLYSLKTMKRSRILYTGIMCIKGDDIYVMVDVTNYSLSYPIGPYTNLMSPDDHFQDMKRVIAAVGGKARRVNVIMPYLYESRQDKRVGRESLEIGRAHV